MPWQTAGPRPVVAVGAELAVSLRVVETMAGKREEAERTAAAAPRTEAASRTGTPEEFVRARMKRDPALEAKVNAYLARGVQMSDLLVPCPQANYGRFMAGFRYEKIARKMGHTVGVQTLYALDVSGGGAA